MKRSLGITVSAIVAILGSGAVLLIAASMLLVTSPEVTSAGPPNMKFAIHSMAFLEIAFAGWGITSAIGLLDLREWARKSFVVFSVLLLFWALTGLLFSVAFMSLAANIAGTESLRRQMASFRIITAALHGFLVFLAVFWLWFLNRRAIREQFGRQPDSVETHRPISISIIGWYLLASGLFLPLAFLFQVPFFFVRWFLKAWASTVFWLLISVLHIVIGIGLLKFKPWARITSICYFTFFLLWALITAAVRGTQAHLQAFQAEIQQKLPNSPVLAMTPSQIRSWVWVGFGFSVFFLGLPLLFIILNRRAFTSSSQGM